MKIIDVDDDCNIIFEDGSLRTCEHRPAYKFQDCEMGYGSHGNCPKWNFRHIDIKSEEK